jgi:hypothetical protein
LGIALRSRQQIKESSSLVSLRLDRHCEFRTGLRPTLRDETLGIRR